MGIFGRQKTGRDGAERKRTNEKAALDALRRIAVDVSDVLASGRVNAACDAALTRLVPAVNDHLEQHRSMPVVVPNTLWRCADRAAASGGLDLAVPLCLSSARYAAFVEDRAHQELVCQPHEMFLGAVNAVSTLAKHLEPLTELSPDRRQALIRNLEWPYLRATTVTFRAAAEFLGRMYGSTNHGMRLVAAAFGFWVVGFEPFVPPQDLDARLAVQEVRFWHAVVMSGTEPFEYEKAYAAMREGIARIIELDQPGVILNGASLARALDVLKFLFFVTGNFSPLLSLELAFEGLADIEQLNLEMPDHPVTRAAMRSRIPLDEPVHNGFGLRLRGVLDTLEGNERMPVLDQFRLKLDDLADAD